jgi:SpoVK/Ycf46/Vps4 family AAA+-type ATPase
VNQFATGREHKPKFSAEFPAKLTTTRMTWNDLVLHPYTADQIEDIKRWIQYRHILEKDENLSRKTTPGYRVLFYGPPGTGKTLTAALLGKEFDKDVYRIDLSQIVSKYIGETEKNLNKIFDRAQHKDWLLFFDEADALFGKRTSVQSSHDRYANQEVSFLLQRIEEFTGLMVLASNFKSNIDEAFLRRFHSIIHFPMPNAQERLKLWQQSLPQSVSADNSIDLRHLAGSYEISGAAIINAVQYASLRALSREGQILQQDDLLNGIRKELLKEEKSL